MSQMSSQYRYIEICIKPTMLLQTTPFLQGFVDFFGVHATCIDSFTDQHQSFRINVLTPTVFHKYGKF